MCRRIAQVVWALGEIPVPVRDASIEVCQGYSALDQAAKTEHRLRITKAMEAHGKEAEKKSTTSCTSIYKYKIFVYTRTYT